MESPTAVLESGWYSHRLRELVERDGVTRFCSAAGTNITMHNPANLEDCALIQRIDDPRDKFLDAICSRDSGERNIPKSLLRGYPLDQTTGGYIYLKDGIISLGCECYDEGQGPCQDCRDGPYRAFPIPTHRFPTWSVAPTADVSSPGGRFLDIQVGTDLVSSAVRSILKTELGKLADKFGHSPAPMYLNIIDPNVGAVNNVWVPTEFHANETPLVEVLAVLEFACQKATGGRSFPPGFLERVCTGYEDAGPALGHCEMRSPIPDVDPRENAELYVAAEQVLEAALPLLARLRLPSLLLPGPLQTVVKAQRIVLEKDELYSGVWHEDGLREHVVAVVLYYYSVSPSLSGGAIEFASKQKQGMYVGDGSGEYHMDEANARHLVNELPRCKVPVSEGTMLVFGNYAAVHRVVPMKAVGGTGSRDFLAFFVIDQREPLPLHRDLGPRNSRMQRRAKLLCEQLQPRGYFGLDDSQVFSTGNGTLADVVWLSQGNHVWEAEDYCGVEARKAKAVISQMNMTPPVLGRGSSYLVELEGPVAQFGAASAWTQYVIEDQKNLILFAHNLQCRFTADPPKEGVSEVRICTSLTEWRELGYWTDNEELLLEINMLNDSE